MLRHIAAPHLWYPGFHFPAAADRGQEPDPRQFPRPGAKTKPRDHAKSDRRVQTVSITNKGRELFVPLLRQQIGLVEKVFQNVSLKEQKQLEDAFKRIGKRAEALALEELESSDGKNG